MRGVAENADFVCARSKDVTHASATRPCTGCGANSKIAGTQIVLGVSDTSTRRLRDSNQPYSQGGRRKTTHQLFNSTCFYDNTQFNELFPSFP